MLTEGQRTINNLNISPVSIEWDEKMPKLHAKILNKIKTKILLPTKS